MVLEAEGRAELAYAVAGDAHANLPIGYFLPDALGSFGRFHSGLAQNLGAGGLWLLRLPPGPRRHCGQRADADIP